MQHKGSGWSVPPKSWCFPYTLIKKAPTARWSSVTQIWGVYARNHHLFTAHVPLTVNVFLWTVWLEQICTATVKYKKNIKCLLKTAAVTFSQLLNSWTISDSGELLQWITIHHMHANQESCSSQHINFTTLITRSLATSVTESFVQPLRAADSLWVWRLNEENGPGLFSDIGVL